MLILAHNDVWTFEVVWWKDLQLKLVRNGLSIITDHLISILLAVILIVDEV